MIATAIVVLALGQCGPAGCPYRSQPVPQAPPVSMSLSQPVPLPMVVPEGALMPRSVLVPSPVVVPMPVVLIRPTRDWGWHLVDYDQMIFPVWGYHVDAHTVRWSTTLPANALQVQRAYELHQFQSAPGD